MIYRKGDEFIIIEAKGGQGKLTSKMINNKSYEQGTREYLESTVGNIEDADLMEEIDDAIKNIAGPKVKYMLVEQPVDSKNKLGITKVSEFNI